MKSKACLLAVILSCIITLPCLSQDITGKWYGHPDFGGIKLRIEFEIQLSDNGYAATMLSPDQSSQEIPASSVSWENGILDISIAPIDFKYTGKLSTDKIEGSFSQMGSTFNMELTRNKPELIRPQNPQPPFPYQEENIVFQNTEAGIELSGTLTLPEAGKNFTTVVLVSGSGPQDRNEELMGHKPFEVLADYLTRQGIAVLRYDDRGFGKSGGVYATASITDFASDTRAAMEYLKTRKEINKKKIGIIGHSEGGAVAFILAAQQIPSFIITLAGPGVQGREMMNLQRAALYKAGGASEDFIIQHNKILDEASGLVITTTDEDELEEKMTILIKGTHLAGKENQLIKQLTSPEIISILQFDPATLYPNIKCPVLALNGEKDLQIIAHENVDAIMKGLQQAGNKKIQSKIYPELNHLFQTAETGLPMEYQQIEETISPQVLKDIASWLTKQ